MLYGWAKCARLRQCRTCIFPISCSPVFRRTVLEDRGRRRAWTSNERGVGKRSFDNACVMPAWFLAAWVLVGWA